MSYKYFNVYFYVNTQIKTLISLFDPYELILDKTFDIVLTQTVFRKMLQKK